MSSEPKKVVNLDRPREGAADEERPGDPVGSAANGDIDRLLSDFLEHINSLAAEYESGGGSPQEPGRQVQEIPAEPVSETIANMAAAIEQRPGPTPDDRHETAPLPFGRDTAVLDEEIERALSALEELPSQREEQPGPAQAATIAAPRADAAEAQPAEGQVEQPAEVVVDAVKATDAIAPPPAVARATQEEVRPVFSYSPRVTGSRRRILIGLAILAALALLAFAIYLLASRSRPVPLAVGAQTAAPPSEATAVSPEPTSEAPQPENKQAGAVETRLPQQATNSPIARDARPRTRGSAGRTSAERAEPEAQSRQSEPETNKPAPAPAVIPRMAVPVVDNSQQSAPPPAAPQQVAPQPAAPQPQAPSITTSSSPAASPPPASISPARSPESDNAPAQSGAPTTPATPSSSPPPLSKPAPQPAASTTTPPRVSKPAATPTVRSATPAELVSKVLPSFPEFARRMNQTGQVDLEIEIDAQGRVTKATAIGGPPIFHQAAADAVRKWRFKPATLDGNSVASHGKVTVVFNKR